MKPDKLFIIQADFTDKGDVYYCPGCAEMLGILELYPRIKPHVEVHVVDFPKPRKAVVDLIGVEHQSCPVLVLGAMPEIDIPGVTIRESNGHAFINDTREIGLYLSRIHGIGKPH